MTWPIRAAVRGRDQYDRRQIEEITVRPLYYFWLGRDAYPQWPMVSRIEVQSDAPAQR